jgi:probable phosphoglycerate mutase
MLTRVVIVRHGETEWSKSGRYTGRTDLPLSRQGEVNASLLAPSLSLLGITHVFTSPRLRARMTCEWAGLGARAQVDPDLAEWDYGDYEGLLSTEILGRNPAWKLFRDGCPGGESPQQVSARADRAIARLRALEGVSAVFSHGHFSRSFAARWIGQDIRLGERLILGTASLGFLSFEHGDPETPSIELWNADPSRFPR